MNIILDAMSGDNAPLEIIKGALMALDDYKQNITLVGNRKVLLSCAKSNGLDIQKDGITIIDASDVITMEDDPFSIKRKPNASMTVALSLLADDKGDVCVSAGNTGALYTGSVIYAHRIKGLRKAALATFLPYKNPVLLIDAGANITVTAENLEQFAIMGSVYVQKILGISSPRVGLLNNGTEQTKGSDLHRDTYKRLSKNSKINFIGNVESKALPLGACDVLVTDGFSGNIVLKLTEGLATLFMQKLKDVYQKNTVTKISATMIKPELSNMKKTMNASEYGGAPLLGVAKPVIKAHGSSDANAIKNAVRVAILFHENNIISEIEKLTQ